MAVVYTANHLVTEVLATLLVAVELRAIRTTAEDLTSLSVATQLTTTREERVVE